VHWVWYVDSRVVSTRLSKLATWLLSQLEQDVPLYTVNEPGRVYCKYTGWHA